MSTPAQDFLARVARILPHGMGLSVDVYSPDLFDLLDALQAEGLTPQYLEVFKASTGALAEVRRRLPGWLLEYHAEGIWLTQPHLTRDYPVQHEIQVAADHLATLGSSWMNHECAAKQMAGYSFGTYLPPIFSAESADLTAAQATWLQHQLDESAAETAGPLLLLEVPPLTYFGFGDLSVPDFFRRIVEQAPCGLVLDIGHVWTIYRYTGAWRRRTPSEFLSEFLQRFPLERVVQIHLAGLGEHPATDEPASLPPWLDAHGARIPAVLFELLEQTLADPRLIHLKGIALEVDTKAIPLIVEEFQVFRQMVLQAPSISEPSISETAAKAPFTSTVPRVPSEKHDAMSHLYRLYAETVSSGTSPDQAAVLPALEGELVNVVPYRCRYLPDEILTWGGRIEDMFPETCRALDLAGHSMMGFVAHWFREPRQADVPYDFFLLKLERFQAFVSDVLPEALPTAAREAADLRTAYASANELVPS